MQGIHGKQGLGNLRSMTRHPMAHKSPRSPLLRSLSCLKGKGTDKDAPAHASLPVPVPMPVPMPVPVPVSLDSFHSPCFSLLQKVESQGGQDWYQPSGEKGDPSKLYFIQLLSKAKQENLRKIKWILVLISALTLCSLLVVFSLCLMTVLTQPPAGGGRSSTLSIPSKTQLKGKSAAPSRLASSLFSALGLTPSFVKQVFIRKLGGPLS